MLGLFKTIPAGAASPAPAFSPQTAGLNSTT